MITDIGNELNYSSSISADPVSTFEEKNITVQDRVIVFLAVFVAGILSFEFASALFGISSLWLPNGVLLAAFLRFRRQDWPLLSLIGGLAILLAYAPLPAWQPWIVLLVAGCLAEIWLSALLLRWWVDSHFSLSTINQVIRFVFICVLLAPIVSSSFALGFLHATAGFPFSTKLLHWYFADALGTAITAPIMLAAYQGSIPQLWQHAKNTQSTGFLVLLAMGGCISLFQPDMAILCLLFPLVILVVVRMGWIVGALGVLTFSIIATGITAAGYGPFAALSRSTIGGRIIELQLVLAALTLSAAVVASAYGERRRILQLADQKERSIRLLTESSPDILFLSDLSSHLLYTSQAVFSVLGYRPLELYRKNIQFDLMHPNEVPTYADALTAVRSQHESRTLIFRMRRKDDSWLWAEGSVSLYRDDQTGDPIGFVNVIRDITHRKEAEDRLQNAYKELEVLAAVDPLTEVANRRHFDAVLDSEWKRAIRNSTSVSLLLIDVDFFKNFNDLHGHIEGDDCLRDIAATISECTHRSTDMVARFGGEEFAVILPETDESGAAALAKRIRETVQSRSFREASKVPKRVTVSVGCSAMVPTRGSSWLPLVEAADKALYHAKNTGRNRVVRASLLE